MTRDDKDDDSEAETGLAKLPDDQAAPKKPAASSPLVSFKAQSVRQLGDFGERVSIGLHLGQSFL
jgi:hypothetical protein